MTRYSEPRYVEETYTATATVSASASASAASTATAIRQKTLGEYGMFAPTSLTLSLSALTFKQKTNMNCTFGQKTENDGKSFETTVSFTTPRPVQPYASWTWNGEQWQPPVPMPDDNILYYWDENSLNWIKVEYDE